MERYETGTLGVCASEVQGSLGSGDETRCKGVRLKVCSWEGVRGEVGEPE